MPQGIWKVEIAGLLSIEQASNTIGDRLSKEELNGEKRYEEQRTSRGSFPITPLDDS